MIEYSLGRHDRTYANFFSRDTNKVGFHVEVTQLPRQPQHGFRLTFAKTMPDYAQVGIVDVTPLNGHVANWLGLEGRVFENRSPKGTIATDDMIVTALAHFMPTHGGTHILTTSGDGEAYRGKSWEPRQPVKHIHLWPHAGQQFFVRDFGTGYGWSTPVAGASPPPIPIQDRPYLHAETFRAMLLGVESSREKHARAFWNTWGNGRLVVVPGVTQV